MKNAVIFGNGLNIKFGGKDYSNAKIIRRGFNTLRQDHKVYDVVPRETLAFFSKLYTLIPEVLSGAYDDTDDVQNDSLLKRFKSVYSSRTLHDMGDIGLEDYLFVAHLIYSSRRKYPVLPDDRDTFSLGQENEALECIQDMLLIGIYNHGKVNRLFSRYSPAFIQFVNAFDAVFTTNYDLNLDNIYSNTVHHIHGQFDVLNQLYDPHSLRNSLSDKQFDANKLANKPGYEYLHSTALMGYSGELKYQTLANMNNLSRLTKADILQVPDSGVDLREKRLALEAQQKIDDDPTLSFQSMLAIENYERFSGEISIIGLSPENDSHVFTDREGVTYRYYYFSDQDVRSAKNTLPSSTEYVSVAELWNALN
ncbi:MAG: hypothetical protein ABF682_02385 [Liquorilactobacillus sp.]|uniref:hypothetical protein n=1 Tax=Liquorilactobacillus sp. TaxID=2767923 RepID=UPI0039E93875